MRNRVLLFLVLINVFCVRATTVSLADAHLVAYNYAVSKSAYKNTTVEHRKTFSFITKNGVEKPLYYMFNLNNNGFVLVAADDNVSPILGYSDEGSIDTANVPPAFQSLLNEYSASIKSIIESNTVNQNAQNQWLASLSASPSYLSVQSSVLPLLKTKWGQSGEYNAYCPQGTLTGCVATAVAQLLNYWKYPSQGFGLVSYARPTMGTISANIAATKYDWSIMPNKLLSTSSSTQKDAVAKLMYQCGVSVYMKYGYGVSVAPSGNVVKALKTNFGYSSNVKIIKANQYFPYTQWENALKNELYANRPVYFSGFEDSISGHAFIVDGIDNTGLFHINWGWDGNSNGYFSISNPNPAGVPNGYKLFQTAIVGIEPKTTIPKQTLDITSLASFPSNITFGSSKTFTVSVKNTGTKKISGNFAIVLTNQKNTFVKTLDTAKNISINPGATQKIVFAFSQISVVPSDYKLGVYYLQIGMPQWQLVNTTLSSYPVNFKVVPQTNAIVMNSLINVNPSPLLLTGGCTVTTKVINKGSATFSGSLYASIYKVNGDWVNDIDVKSGITIAPNASIQLVFSNSSNTNLVYGTFYIAIRVKTGSAKPVFVKNTLLFPTSTLKSFVLPNNNTNGNKLDSTIPENSFNDFRFDAKIYPNPVVDYLTIDVTGNDNSFLTNTHIKIIDIKGQLVKEEEMNSLENTINMADLKDGVYFLNIQNGTSIGQQKFIKISSSN
ncbi:MAG: thiol protease/hemagglutinin PrtT [Bacteroidetes bacterium]|nr:thiol protease/hemagglutinin PrtT [Bacteroidota bacterium]